MTSSIPMRPIELVFVELRPELEGTHVKRELDSVLAQPDLQDESSRSRIVIEAVAAQPVVVAHDLAQ